MKLPSLPFGSWTFKPNLAFSVLLVFILPILLLLGTWQIHRGFAKQALLAQLDTRQTQAPSLLNSIDFTNPNSARFTPVVLTGEFLNSKTLLLDNQILRGQAGYRVLTPVMLETNQILLIDRGWIPVGKSRSVLPHLDPIDGKQILTGLINQPSTGVAFNTRGLPENPSWPLVIQHLDYNQLPCLFGTPVLHAALYLKQGSPFVFQPMPLSFGMSPTKHWGYAVQWFSLALVIMVYYLVISLARKE